MKILIWDYPIHLKNSGGPAGYLYNIREYLKSSKDSNNEIVFLKDLLSIKNNQITKHQKYNRLINLIYKIDKLQIWNLLNTFRRLKNWYQKFNDNLFSNIDFNQFDVIHFHVCYHILSSAEILRNFKGIKILTSHSPQPLSEEFCTCPELYSPLNRIIGRKLQKKELKAWTCADYIMFPVKDATEVYFSNPALRKFIKTNTDKLIFCPTALIDKIPSYPKNIRKNLNIPEKAFILTYIGRHNEIKGYDQLLKIGDILLNKYNNLYIVVAGNESPLFGLKHPRWIELGWINYGQDLISQSDAFILPNKETYFDLITLEVLREGTPIILSFTGGNKYFAQLNQSERSGMFFYDYNKPFDVDSIINKLQTEKSSKGLSDYRKLNIQLFNKYFTMSCYISNYKSIIKNLLSNKKR